MINTVFLREFSQLLLKHGASLEDLIGMVYTQEELDPQTEKYKKYFWLIKKKPKKEDSKKYPSDFFVFKIRYNLDLAGKKIPSGKATYTTKTSNLEEAVKLGFDNRLEVLKKYEVNKVTPERGKAFFIMLTKYFEEGSKYLQDDTVVNKREVVLKSRKEARTFIKEDLIPYLQEKKINHIQDITVSIYNGFKIYLQAKGIKDKTINNRLNFFTRILDYHLRNGLVDKLPYTKGTATLKLTGKQEKEDADILPIEKLKGIYPHKKLIDPITLINFMNPTVEPLSYDNLSLKEQKEIFNCYMLPFLLVFLL